MCSKMRGVADDKEPARQEKSMPEINGFCDEQFLPLRDAFIANYDAGLELGSSLALTHNGKLVVDIWAGHGDPDKTRAWEKDTIVMVYSTTKIMAALCALMVVDRGLLELDKPIARYWPEFAAGGKAAVTVRDALTHRAGVPGFASPISQSTVTNWSEVTARIAAEPHWFDGRRVLCYHVFTFGFILGELIRRVDGRKPAQFLREEIAAKLPADFQIGLSSQSELARVAAPGGATSPPQRSVNSLAGRLVSSVQLGAPDWQFLSADIPSGTGFGNGRSLAQICAIFAMGGEVGGVRYLSERMVQEVGKEQVFAEDPLMGPLRFGLGLALNSSYFPAPSKTSIHWGGFGGSWGLADPKARVSLGYAPNNLIVETDGDLPMEPRLRRFSAALERLLPTL